MDPTAPPTVPTDADLLASVRSLIGPAARDPVLAGIAAAAHAASVVLVWERLGPDRLDEEETAFVTDVGEAVSVSLPVRAQLLSSDRGVRLLPPGRAA